MANGRPIWKRRRHRLATKSVPPRPVPRLYLATPEVDDPSSLAASLPGLLARADVAAVLLRLRPTDPRSMISRVKALAPAIQDKGAALLLDGHVELVGRAGGGGADGRRAGDQAGLRRNARKSQSRTGIAAGNENPASHIDPRKRSDADGKCGGASLADASGR